MTTQTLSTEVWTPEQLDKALLEGRRFALVDVRNREDFRTWPVSVPPDTPVINVPYFEILEQGGKEDMVESVVAYAKANWSDQLPQDRPVLVVCAKGQTSAYVAQGLRKLGYEAYHLEGGMEKWGNYYSFRTVVSTPRLTITQVVRPARGCLGYVIASGSQAALVDPFRHHKRYLDWTGKLGLQVHFILDTHAHADHISGGPALARETGQGYYFHPYDAIHPIDVLPARINYEFVQDGQEFRVGEVTIRAIHVPGHTLGNLVYLVDGKYLLSGDTIFVRSIARPDLGGRGEAWAPLHYDSLQKLLALPDETVVLPGHFSQLDEADRGGLFQATLAHLKEHNQGVRMAAGPKDKFVEYILGSLPQFPQQYVDIKRVNAGLLEADEEKQSELELGQNVCALSDAYKN